MINKVRLLDLVFSELEAIGEDNDTFDGHLKWTRGNINVISNILHAFINLGMKPNVVKLFKTVSTAFILSKKEFYFSSLLLVLLYDFC